MKEEPDVIFVDWDMPIVGGAAFLRKKEAAGGSLTAPLLYAPFAHRRYASIHSAPADGGFGSGRSRIGID